MIFGWAMFVLGVLAAHWAGQLFGSRREAKRLAAMPEAAALMARVGERLVESRVDANRRE